MSPRPHCLVGRDERPSIAKQIRKLHYKYLNRIPLFFQYNGKYCKETNRIGANS